METFHTVLSDLTLEYDTESEIALCFHTARPQCRQIARVCDSVWSIEFWTNIYLMLCEAFQTITSETASFYNHWGQGILDLILSKNYSYMKWQFKVTDFFKNNEKIFKENQQHTRTTVTQIPKIVSKASITSNLFSLSLTAWSASLKITWRKSLINKHIWTRSCLSDITCTRAEITVPQRKEKHLNILLEFKCLWSYFGEAQSSKIVSGLQKKPKRTKTKLTYT